MSDTIRQLEPRALWRNFADLNAVPRPSKKEERVIAFMKQFGEKLGLPVLVDEAGNVIITKPATKGMEKKETVVLQSHLDMVHQKNSDTSFDFETQGIDMFVQGDWVKASGTTLGADNGIGVAAIMALLQSTDIPHPALEALFTIDEETGMTGALALKGGLLKGGIMLNLDTEDDKDLTIGCAGGIDITAHATYTETPPKGGKALLLTVKGLTGGHSGMDIILGRGNANKIMNRLLLLLHNDYQAEIASVDGGSLRNAIPRESKAVLVVPAEKIENVKTAVADFQALLQREYHTTDPQLLISANETTLPGKVADVSFTSKLLRSLHACPNGIYRMSPDIPDLVQTSNNLARVMFGKGECQVQCLSRSSVDSEKTDLSLAITSAFELCGAEVKLAGGYPGWTPNPSSPVVKLMTETYSRLFNEEARVSAVHAGLECGILGRNYPSMQMISFGPNIHGAHSPDEKVQISSVQKFWKFLLETLKQVPDRNV